MARWRYLAQRLTGDGAGEFLDYDVPLAGVQIEEVLSGYNSLTGSINPKSLRLDQDGSPLLEEWSTAIYAERDGQIVGGGILNDLSLNGPELSVDCIGFMGYFDEMPYTGSGAAYVEADPAQIIRDISAHVQGQTDGNIGLEFVVPSTEVRIGVALEQVEFDTQAGPVSFESGPYKLNNYDTLNLGEKITGLCEDTPFEFREQHYWDGEEIRHRALFGHPTLGRRRDDLRFVVGENVGTIPTVDRSGDDWASDVILLGAGTGPSMLRVQSAHRRGRLRRPKVITESSIRVKSTGQRLVDRELQARNARDKVSTIRVWDSPHAQFGDVQVGDEILLEGRLDWKTIEIWNRVESISYSPDEPDSYDLTIERSDKILG